MEFHNSKLFLGVDGGQSHTEAIIAGENGTVLGRGIGGPSNHAEQPGGRERLRSAVFDSVASALECLGETAGIGDELVLDNRFRSAHFGMTGGANFKQEVINEVVSADVLSVGHDAPTALIGATAGDPGVVVIAGTGSVVFADDGKGNTAQVGGMGYVFADEGSGFWLSAQMIRLAIKESDGCIPDTGLARSVLEHFRRRCLIDVVNGFYNGVITRDEIASLSRVAHDLAVDGNVAIRNEIASGARVLAEGVATAARRVGFKSEFRVSYAGGMFDGELMLELFRRGILDCVTRAALTKPVFGPAIGALLMAYKQVGIPFSRSLIDTIISSQAK